LAEEGVDAYRIAVGARRRNNAGVVNNTGVVDPDCGGAGRRRDSAGTPIGQAEAGGIDAR
jgi:hypothetical protein